MLKMVSAALAALSCVASAAQAATTCTLQQTGELPITFDRGRVMVDAEIDGVPLKMLVDTGAEATTLYRETSDKLGLRATQVGNGMKMYGVGGSDLLSRASVKEFKVGGLVAHNVNMAVTGHQNSDLAAGLLGAQFLFQSDVEFDIPEGKLRFFKPVGCSGDQVVYWGKAYSVLSNISPNPDLNIQVNVKLGDAPVSATIDSGASRSVVNRQTAARLSDRAIGMTAAGKSFGIGKEEVDTSLATFPSFSFGEDETIRNAKLEVADLFEADREVDLGSRIARKQVLGPQMIIGADFFRAHRVYISKAQRKVYVSYVGGPVFDTRSAPTPTAGQTKP